MPYTNFTDRAIPYHLDGSVVKIVDPTLGVIKSFTPTEMAEINDEDYVNVPWQKGDVYAVIFFPELRDITAIFGICYYNSIMADNPYAISDLQGSTDSTNGLDGTWNNATLPNGYPPANFILDNWRKGFKAITGLSGVKAIRFRSNMNGAYGSFGGLYALHLYGHKTAGQTPDDLIFLDAENADAEFAIPLDFADRPAGTSAIHQIKIKNTSATLTASNITVESIDPVDDIRLADSSSGPWVTSKSITSLGPGASTSVIYVKCETDAPPTPLGPMRAPIKTTVGAWA